MCSGVHCTSSKVAEGREGGREGRKGTTVIVLNSDVEYYIGDLHACIQLRAPIGSFLLAAL